MSNLSRLSVLVVALLLAVGVGVGAYQAGVAHGIEQSGKIIVPPPGPYPYPYPYPYYGWHGPWHFGFFGPLVFFAFWFLILRGLFWRRAGYGGGCGYRGRFEEWHRQAHGREAEAPAAGGGGER
ncbi:MAG TPA: hypothetical protein VLV54_01430 [Thermoanaerobaculia bacterium]|nr:hypothetical protein [Thermoanaerobaculia bacterium]